MSKKFKATKQLTIHAPLATVWKALTDPAMLKQYFFGTDLHTSWQVGTPIRFTGEWEGTAGKKDTFDTKLGATDAELEDAGGRGIIRGKW